MHRFVVFERAAKRRCCGNPQRMPRLGDEHRRSMGSRKTLTQFHRNGHGREVAQTGFALAGGPLLTCAVDHCCHRLALTDSPQDLFEQRRFLLGNKLRQDISSFIESRGLNNIDDIFDTIVLIHTH